MFLFQNVKSGQPQSAKTSEDRESNGILMVGEQSGNDHGISVRQVCQKLYI